MKEKLLQAQEHFNRNFEKNSIDIKGKQYSQVAYRLQVFRKFFPDAEIITDMVTDEPISLGDKMTRRVVFKGSISIDNKIISTGYAEEWQHKGMVNATSHIENCETSCIGRCLANLGFSGSEYASVDEIDIAKNKQEQLADLYSLKDFEKDLDNCKHPGHLGELVTKKKDWLDKLPEGDKNKARNLYTQREDQMRSLKEGKFLNE